MSRSAGKGRYSPRDKAAGARSARLVESSARVSPEDGGSPAAAAHNDDADGVAVPDSLSAEDVQLAAAEGAGAGAGAGEGEGEGEGEG